MQPIIRRKRWTSAIMLVVVSPAALAVAGPAVAKPAHAAQVSGAALSTPGIIAVAVIAVFGALALLLLALLSSHRGGTATGAVVRRPRPVRRTSSRRIAA